MGPILVAIGHFIMAHTTAYIWIMRAVQLAVVIGASAVYSNQQRIKARRQAEAARQQGRGVMVRDPVATRVAIYGEAKVSGSIPFMTTSGTKNEYLHIIVALAGHECEEIRDIYFGSEVVPLDGSGGATGTYAGHARVKKFLGIGAGERDTDLESESGGSWTSAHLGKHVARLHVRLKWNVDKFPQGIPNIQAIVKGKKVRDYRNASYTRTCGTTAGSSLVTCADVSSLATGMRVEGDGIPYAAKITGFGGGGFTIDIPAIKTSASVSLLMYAVAWSMNPALCLADFLNDPVVGRGIHGDRIHTDSVVDAANVSDESVVRADATTEYRYTANGVVTSDMNPADTIADLAGAMAGCVVDAGGVWRIRAGAWRTPTVTLTDSDLVGAFKVQPRLSRQDTFNRVRGLYYSPENQWALADFPAIKNDTYKDADGGVWLDKDLTLGFTTSPATAQRLAKIELERNRQQIVVSSQWNLKAMQCMPGDVVGITRGRLGWSSKYFEVIEWGFVQVGDEHNPALGINMTLRETAEGVWDWADGEETTVDLAPNTTLPDPWSVPTPSGLTATSGATTVLIQPDGPAVPRVLLEWSTPNNIHVESGGKVRIEYKRHTDSTWIVWNEPRGDALADYVANVKAGISHDFRIQFQNNAGVRGAYSSTVTHLVAGDTTAPSVPSGFSFIAGNSASFNDAPQFSNGIRLLCAIVEWTDNTEDDLQGYRLVLAAGGTSQAALDASAVGEPVFREPRFVLTSFIPLGLHVFVQSVDLSGNASMWVDAGETTPYWNYPIGSLSQQNSDDVQTSGIKIGSAAAISVQQIKAKFVDSVVPTMTGGSPTEYFTVSLTNRGFSTKPDSGSVQCSNDTNILAAYDYDHASNSSTVAYIRVYTRDGTNLGAGTIYRFSIELNEI